MDTRTSPVTQRLAELRLALARTGCQALLVPSADPHLSEYLPERWQARQWLSGFTGSVATLVVTERSAVLFADSRYWTQAEAELAGSGIELVRVPTAAPSYVIEWLTQHLSSGHKLAVDTHVLGLAFAQALLKALTAQGIALVHDQSALESIWPDRPGLPTAPVVALDAPWVDRTRTDKLGELRAAMKKTGATHHLISTVDDLAWTLNLRGSDVDYNPVFIGHLLVDTQQAQLFMAEGKVDAALNAQLAAEGVHLRPYEQATVVLAALPAGSTVLLDPKRVTYGVRNSLPQAVRVVEAINPSTQAKSRKSAADAAHVRDAMERDGAALCEFYAEFEAALAAGEAWTELTVDERMTAARARQPGFKGLSFATIAGWQANGALPHYRATPESHAALGTNGLLLIDSGGQYLAGTTDITRVWALGEVTAEQKADYTRVLRGTIALSRTCFPRGTLGPMLDAIARAPLWEAGLDYGHGTGHGVGYYLGVHEGPQNISKGLPDPSMAMEPGMITSIEPGLYRPGQWGVRIENLVLNVPLPTAENGAFGEMLAFETLTLCPIDTRPIERSLLQAHEIDWLNRYHATVRERLLPRVSGAAKDWLLRRTEAI
ncbi:aminopeptidase P family protein [Inhella gelatinilytica]|uniref:Aminopeptidase P family protein n=1 Tax=Inhella gelatinilytica TaxID=2795030 RepID=A0A931IV80_9BURK|nr:aminopeptidase P family protein [Inhella gelatinilytica]MBH9552774.1 aminopeptidase P family protein [Inhella gelatinilytica]